MKKILGLLLLFWTLIAGAGVIELSENSSIPAGKGWAVLTIDAPNPNDFAYLIGYSAVKGLRNFHDFSYGKAGPIYDKSPDLQEKYGSKQRGRLVVLELDPGDYLLDSINIRQWFTDKSSDGALGVKFKIEEGQARYLGHWNLEIGDTEGRAGTAVGILLFLNDMGGFSASLKVSSQFSDIQRIFSQHAPLVTPLLREFLVKSAMVSRDFHPVAKYAPSGFAEIGNIAAVPLNSSNSCRENYENWLKQKSPRAFAVGVTKGCGFTWGNQPKNPEDSPIPAERVISACERAHGYCVLYAVDDRVVYIPTDARSVSQAQKTVPEQAAMTFSEVHAATQYPATGFAEVSDIEAVPLGNSVGCRKQYENWLKQKPPRAFAVGMTKGCGFTWGNQPKNPEDSPIPAERAVSACERTNGACVLYAVDDRVVYKKPD